MSSNQISYALQTVKNTSGKKAKEALLRQLQAEFPEESARIMRAVFDKDITYGFAKKIPKPDAPAVVNRITRPRQFGPSTWELLDKLASRELSGKAAKTAVAQHLGRLSEPSRLLFECILQQNLRAGFGIDVVVGIWGQIVETFDVCLAHEWREEMYGKARPRIAANEEEYDPSYHSGFFPVWADVKYDGLRGFRFENTPALVSRKKLPLSCPDSLQRLMTEFLAEARDYLSYDSEELFLDVEIVSADGVFRDAMSNARASKKGASDGSLVVKVIDLLSVEEVREGRSEDDQKERRKRNEEMFADERFQRLAPYITLSEGRECASAAEVEAFAGEAWDQALEGVIVKPYQGFWETKRSYYWLKLKAKGNAKGRIKGYVMADLRGKNTGLVGSVIMEEDSGVRTRVAGMTDSMRAYISKNQEALMDEQIEATFHERTPDGVMRHPRIKAIRSDRE